jgi:hypothetical protein
LVVIDKSQGTRPVGPCLRRVVPVAAPPTRETIFDRVRALGHRDCGAVPRCARLGRVRSLTKIVSCHSFLPPRKRALADLFFLGEQACACAIRTSFPSMVVWVAWASGKPVG